MTRMTARGAGVLALVVGACLLIPAPSAAATIEYGWWWRANSNPALNQPPAPVVSSPVAPPAPPAPPNTEGGLQVAALPDGALSVAAVRVDEDLTSITLRVAPNGDANGANAKLAACRASTPWEPVVAGSWDTKPVVACDLVNGGGSVAGVRAEDGSTWTFPVAPLAEDGLTDVVIVPLTDSEAVEGVAAPFQLVFEPPTASDLVVAPAVEQPRASPDDAATDELFADPGTYDDFTSITGAAPAAAPVVRPALDGNDQAPVVPSLAAAGVGESDNGSQVLGAAIVLLGIGLLFWAARQPTPPIVSLVQGGRVVPGAPPQIGGLGRFARPRAGKPPSLQ